MAGTGGDAAVWHDAEQRLRAELRRIDDVADDLRAATRDLKWQGPGAGRFRWRTARRLRELAEQRWLLHTALTLVQRAAAVPPAPTPAAPHATTPATHQDGTRHTAPHRTSAHHGTHAATGVSGSGAG